MDEEKRKAFAFIASHPRIEAWLIAQRFIDFWTGTATPLAAFRQADSNSLRFILLSNDAAPFCAFLGVLLLLGKKNPFAVPIISVVVFFPLLYYITHTSLRYRHPIDPLVLLLAAIGVHGLWTGATRKRRKTTAPEDGVR